MMSFQSLRFIAVTMVIQEVMSDELEDSPQSLKLLISWLYAWRLTQKY
jgi:hypothetical protein